VTRAKGQIGETAAAAYLAKRGIKVIAQNVHTPFGEIDLVCCDGETQVFVEVKWRSRQTPGDALAAVDCRKQQRLSRAAAYWLAARENDGPARFDVIGLAGEPGEWRVEHIRNAFMAEE